VGLGNGLPQGRLDGLGGGPAHRLPDQPHGGFPEDAGGLPGLVPVDPAPGWVRGFPGDPCPGEGQAVDPDAVAVLPGEDHRPVGNHPVQVGPGGKAAPFPDGVVPAPPHHPLPGGNPLGGRPHPVQGLGQAVGSAQVDLPPGQGPGGKVDVGVHKTRHRQAAPAVQPDGFRTGQAEHRLLGADQDHPTLIGGETLGRRPGRVQGAEPGVINHQVGPGHRSASAGPGNVRQVHNLNLEVLPNRRAGGVGPQPGSLGDQIAARLPGLQGFPGLP